MCVQPRTARLAQHSLFSRGLSMLRFMWRDISTPQGTLRPLTGRSLLFGSQLVRFWPGWSFRRPFLIAVPTPGVQPPEDLWRCLLLWWPDLPHLCFLTHLFLEGILMPSLRSNRTGEDKILGLLLVAVLVLLVYYPKHFLPWLCFYNSFHISETEAETVR